MVRMVKPPDNTAWPLYRASSNLLHYPIFKNGHSAISDWLKGKPLLFETFIRDEPPAGAAGFAVLRDPFDRYISALAQMWRMGHLADIPWRTYIDGVAAWNKRTSSPWTNRGDRHFLPQSNVVDRMPASAIFFRLDDLSSMINWLSDRCELERGDLPALSHQKRTDRELITYARIQLNDRIIRRHYSRDQLLWAQLQEAG